MNDTPHIRTVNLSRIYTRGKSVVRALDNVSISINRGECLSIVGSSGSGKTTLLNLLAGLDTPSNGTVEVDGVELLHRSRKEISNYRASKIGMIFQSFNLIQHYTALENVEAALLFNQTSPKERRVLAMATLDQLGMTDRMLHRPSDLSGGEQQRVAVARAIVKKPEILFADEPTGNLDLENATAIADLLSRLNSDGLTVVIVTHNLDLAEQYTDRTIKMQYGKVVSSTLSPTAR
jgi:putative ABC transport system ATP-binding protein